MYICILLLIDDKESKKILITEALGKPLPQLTKNILWY